jgi:murein L,D-transpeptidase YcbB/YkuD
MVFQWIIHSNKSFIESIKKKTLETPFKVETPVKVEFDYKIVIKNPIIIFQENNGLTPDGDIGPVTIEQCVLHWTKRIQVVLLLIWVTSFTRLVENTNYSAQGMANTWPTIC